MRKRINPNSLKSKALAAVATLPLLLNGCTNPAQKYHFTELEQHFFYVLTDGPLNKEEKELVYKNFPEFKGRKRLSYDESAFLARELAKEFDKTFGGFGRGIPL